LIENGSDINGNSKMGTPLMACVVKGNNEIAKFLIEKKADIHLADTNGTTPIIYATNFKNYEVVSLLIKAGADYTKKDNRGNSALDYAILLDDDKLIETLKNKKL
jgi:ankyrin repeat protein